MRKLITTSGERFDIEAIKPDIEEIVSGFDRYLDNYPVKTSRSMHSLLGPVPMILDGARVRKESVETLVGRAIRAHEMNPRAKGYLPPDALVALEAATAKLLDLCQTVPITAVTKVTERIRYSVYYVRRKKGIERLEQTRQEFINFLQNKYASETALAEAWNEPDLTFEKVYYPSNKNEAYKKANATKKADIDAFHTLLIADRLIIDEEDEDNE